MAKRKSSFHASPGLLGLGLVVVMALVIILGVSQVNNSQVVRSRASEIDSRTSVSCSLSPLKPQKDTSIAIDVDFFGGFTCSSPVTITKYLLWGTHDGIAYLPETGCTSSCYTNDYYTWYKKTMITGTHTYCSWAQVWWTQADGSHHTLGPKRSPNCTTLSR